MSTRNRGWRRKKDFSKGHRKKRIAESVCRDSWYEHDGQYIKGKIHCSCPCCSPKTNNRGRYGAAMKWKHTDAQKILSMNSKMEDFIECKVS